jgi:hypothetical protein
MHKAKQCLTLCKGPLRLFIDHWFYGHDLSIPKLTSQSVTARKLRCNAELAQVTEIDITFNPSSNGSVLVSITILIGCSCSKSLIGLLRSLV